MDYLHQSLLKKFKWYKKWHEHPHHNNFHWLILLFVFILEVFFFTSALANPSDNSSEFSIEEEQSNIKTFDLLKGKAVGHAKDRILVKFRNEADEYINNDLLSRHNLKVKEKIRGTDVKIVTVPPGLDPDVIVEKLKKVESSAIEFAEVDKLISPEYIPNDPKYISEYLYIKRIQVPAVWEAGSVIGVPIAICDTGIDGGHEDLSPIIRYELGFNTVDNSNNWAPVHAHGTWVAGAAAAIFNNSLGIAGVGQGSIIIPVRISNLDNGGAYLSDGAECITYAADNGARAINLSYDMGDSPTIEAAASYAESKNAITVMAAGNNGYDPGWPDLPSVVAVGAVDNVEGLHIYWSNYGNYIDLVAPGDYVITTSPGNQYAKVSGTSLSAPLVAGAIAVLSRNAPDKTAKEIKEILYASATDLGDAGKDITYGYGMLSAKRAKEMLLGIDLTNTDTVPPAVSITYPTSKSGIKPNSTLNITVNASDASGIRLVDTHISKVTKLSGRSITVTALSQCIDEVEPFTCTWTVPNVKGATYMLQATAYDNADIAELSKYVQFTVR